MATSAAAHKARAPKNSGRNVHPFKRWWQQILFYPAFAVALVTAGPEWIDKGRALALGIKGGSAAEAEKQAQLWRKNLSCSAAPFAWFNNPSNVKVDATICDSGDIFVRASAPDNSNYFKWVPLEDVLRSAGQGGGLIPAAHAATLSATLGHPGRPARMPMFKLAQGQANIICQKFIDDRHILRRVQTPQGCFDEVIDTFNGSVVSRNPAPCTPQC